MEDAAVAKQREPTPISPHPFSAEYFSLLRQYHGDCRASNLSSGLPRFSAVTICFAKFAEAPSYRREELTGFVSTGRGLRCRASLRHCWHNIAYACKEFSLICQFAAELRRILQSRISLFTGATLRIGGGSTVIFRNVGKRSCCSELLSTAQFAIERLQWLEMKHLAVHLHSLAA